MLDLLGLAMGHSTIPPSPIDVVACSRDGWHSLLVGMLNPPCSWWEPKVVTDFMFGSEMTSRGTRYLFLGRVGRARLELIHCESMNHYPPLSGTSCY